MTKQYSFEQLGNNPKAASEKLNLMAEEGWEVVPGVFTIVNGRYVLLLERENIKPAKKGSKAKKEVEVKLPEE